MNNPHFILLSTSAAATARIAATSLKTLPAGTVVALCGELGSGKTCFVKGLLKALNGNKNFPAASPTFTYANEYTISGRRITHMDMYRIGRPEDIINFRPEEYFSESYLTFIEWAENIEKLLPETSLRIEFNVADVNKRQLRFTSRDTSLIEKMRKALCRS